MKKILLFLALASLAITSCKNDDDNNTTQEVSIETQNAYDDEAIQKFLKDNYFDSRGNIVAFSSTSTTDDNEKPLSEYSPVKLNSGVVYISRYTPTNGKTIAATDKIRIMHNTQTYVAVKGSDNIVKFDSKFPFRTTIISSGTPEIDPAYYYVRNSVLTKYNTDNKTTKTRTFYEMEGFQEAIKNFQSCEIPDDADYNLQGVIIVPSRAAYARDEHFAFSSISFKNRSFVFNFQVYKTETRTSADD
ncbi:hypothetical protein [Cloacibacterium sp. TD35]|uniref:hypothetical protein n=1 Tax=Cloacibacterium sp. TD35 TaxID=2976818 RepID=UPI00237DD44A|nr:hypothetical protein [Cloacibacterium sp. TD35]WDT66997.1 hypothetical protein N7277_06550 [Cloacibacterium sp. TD35]